MGKQKIEKDDILLIDEFKNGNSEAFGEIYNRYFKKVVRQLKVLLKGDVEKAEDLASDVFLKVMKNIDKYKHEKLSSWIHTMARNVFLDSLRLVKEKENKKLARATRTASISPADLIYSSMRTLGVE